MNQKLTPSRVLKVTWPPVEGELVVLHGFVYEGPAKGEESGICYDYVHMTGDPEKDRWRGRAHDFTAAIFLRPRARAAWVKHVRALDLIVKNNRVKPSHRCACK